MIVLQGVNSQTVAFILANIHSEQAQQYMEVFAEALLRTGQNPTLYYRGARVQPSADPSAIQANAPSTVSPSYPAGDWALMLHPSVLAQTMVDLAEREGLPIIDGLYVNNGEWQRLTDIQPSAAAQSRPAPVQPQAAPAPQPAAAPVAAPVAQAPNLQQPPPADPYPQPVPISTTTYEQQPVPIQLAPEDVVEDAQFTDATSPAATGTLQPASNVVQLQPSAAALAAQAQPQAQVAPPTGTGSYGLPQPTTAASKGASPFDKDPGGEPPKTPPARQLRDLVDMAPHLFAAPAGDVVGKGNGSAQRLRMYTAALLFVDRLLASVPDQNCPVGYLRFQIEHLRYHAGQSPAAPTMLAHEQWLFSPETK